MTREAMESLAAVLGKRELRYHNYVQGKCCWGHSPTCLEDVVVFVTHPDGEWSGSCRKHVKDHIKEGWKIWE